MWTVKTSPGAWRGTGNTARAAGARSREAKAAPAQESKTLEEIIGDIPAFASRPDDLIIPSSRYISTEIRRTKAKLANLQRLQGAVRELRRHKHLLQGMGND
jgi:hypothetical protein